MFKGCLCGTLISWKLELRLASIILLVYTTEVPTFSYKFKFKYVYKNVECHRYYNTLQ